MNKKSYSQDLVHLTQDTPSKLILESNNKLYQMLSVLGIIPVTIAVAFFVKPGFPFHASNWSARDIFFILLLSAPFYFWLATMFFSPTFLTIFDKAEGTFAFEKSRAFLKLKNVKQPLADIDEIVLRRQKGRRGFSMYDLEMKLRSGEKLVLCRLYCRGACKREKPEFDALVEELNTFVR